MGVQRMLFECVGRGGDGCGCGLGDVFEVIGRFPRLAPGRIAAR